MEPSKEAVEAVFSKVEELEGGIHLTADMKRIVKMSIAAYPCAIDFAAHQQAMREAQAHIKAVSSFVISRYSELFPNYAYTEDQSAVDLMADEVKAARAERDRLKTEVDAEKRYSLLLAQRIIELQAEMSAIKEMYRQQCVSTTDCGAKLDKANQQLAEAQAEVNKWTRMAACAGFDKSGLLAVGEELQKRDQKLADQRAAMDGLVEALKALMERLKYIPHSLAENDDAIEQAKAAIAAAEKLTKPQDQLVFDLDKAERIGEQLTRDSPVVNGPAKVEP